MAQSNQLDCLLKTCRTCNAKFNIEEFAQCAICSIYAHTCKSQFKNSKVGTDFFKTANLTGFKYICVKCSPVFAMFSSNVLKISDELSKINNGIAILREEMKSIKESSNVDNACSNDPSLPPTMNTSFANIVKQSTLVLIPKDPNIEKTQLKEKIRNSIDPETSKITGLHSTSKNKIILKSGSSDISTFASVVEEQLGADFNVKIHDGDRRRLKVVKFESNGLKPDEILNAIVSQNTSIKEGSDLKLIKQLPNPIDKNQSTLILELDAESHQLTVNQGYVYVRWNRFKVYDALMVNRCYKCSRLGHISANCKSENHICPRCSEHHKIEECKAINVRCINCDEANRKFRMNVDI